eukprot:3970227-Pyramimonas_sp.AAC.1
MPKWKNVGFIPSGTYPPADAVVRSVAHFLSSNHCDINRSLFSAWIRAVEASFASHHGQASLGRPRAEGPKFRTDAPMRGRISGWWARTHVVLDAYSTHRARNNGAKQQQ